MITRIRKVDNLKEPDKPWSLEIRSVVKLAPSFWYYSTEAEAEEVAAKLRGDK